MDQQGGIGTERPALTAASGRAAPIIKSMTVNPPCDPRPPRDPADRAQDCSTDLQAQIDRLGQFNLDIAHDLNGPLGSIGLLAALAEQQLDRGDLEQVRLSLRRIAGQARDSQTTLDALLCLSGALGAAPRHLDTDLGAVAQAASEAAALAVGTAHPGAALPGVAVEPLGRAQTGPGLLHTVLVNLIGNALKFNQGRPDVRVVVRREPDACDRVALVVSDNGVGFDATPAGATQVPSERAEPGAMLPGEGRGLGIVRRAVAHLGGTVELQSRPGHGTAVRFTLGRG
jgi:signal transduction histidine kinase